MRGSFIKGPKRRRGVYLIPNLLTTGNLFSGLASILFAFNGDFQSAAIAVFVAIVFDTLDGTSARLMKSTSQFGLQYDSLGDLISFGVAPGLIIYAWALNTPTMLGAAVMFAFVACGALRLARYNVMATSSVSDSKAFTGLPIPGAAGVIASFVIFDLHVFALSESIRPIVGLVMSLSLSFLMVSTIRYRSIKDLQFRESHHFNYLVYAILILMAVLAYPQLMLLVLFGGYAMSGVLEQGCQTLANAFGKRKDSTLVRDPVHDSKDS
ncbi:MAG: CDP-diacylglycerol--serine O-phosphatidyltransferase [Nitrospirales bacterium]|nr:CDP-diacylglycerol--serine O-phosphatidyltransferase [Nitrospira sp.]MDR4502032.1 CDP-diacylglycerol--serine O-phosphatidyltransferase [Nitrospirales bacterium]